MCLFFLVVLQGDVAAASAGGEAAADDRQSDGHQAEAARNGGGGGGVEEAQVSTCKNYLGRRSNRFRLHLLFKKVEAAVWMDEWTEGKGSVVCSFVGRLFNALHRYLVGLEIEKEETRTTH